MAAMAHPTAKTYPVRVQARLEPGQSRWLWLVKWVLAIPHYVILAFLWVAFFVTTVFAGFAILFTGHYPRSIFTFNVGVLRWTWRVQYYAYGALATDHYPPFSLDDDPNYPARFDVAYPDHLSRGLVLIKWWLLAIPQYLIVAVFGGGASWALFRSGNAGFLGGGLIGLLALIAAVILLFTGRYPTSIFDFVLGMNRWVLRVAAYAGLMTDDYPPFRLDMGGDDPGSMTFERTDPPAAGRVPLEKAAPAGPYVAPPPVEPPHPSASEPFLPLQPPREPRGMGPGRIIAVILGAILTLIGFGITAGGGVLAWADNSRDAAGYLNTGSVRLESTSAVITSNGFTVDVDGQHWLADRLGTIRITARSANGKPVFVGIAREQDVRAWIGSAASDRVRNVRLDPVRVTYTAQPGAVRPVPAPTSQQFWSASASGATAATLTWHVTGGRWTAVVANADGSTMVSADAKLGAKLPFLGPLSIGLIIGGIFAILLGVAVILIAVMTQRRRDPAQLRA